jgi:hypothetical protein
MITPLRDIELQASGIAESFQAPKLYFEKVLEGAQQEGARRHESTGFVARRDACRHGRKPYRSRMEVHVTPEIAKKLNERLRLPSRSVRGPRSDLGILIVAILHGRRNPRVLAALLRGRE